MPQPAADAKIDETKVFDYAIGPFDPGKSKLTVGGD
jgi:hypothetical protein